MIQAIRALMLLTLLWAGLAHAAAPEASLDRDRLHLGESVTLRIRIDGDMKASSPDLAPLRKDFQILDTSRSGNYSIVNGSVSASTLWTIELQPRREGTLAVPALQVAGGRTRALSVQVDAASGSASAAAGAPVFLEVALSTDHPYVGQQVVLTVRLFYAPNLTDGSLEAPEADGLQVRPLGRDQQYRAERGGRAYHVLERRYALFAQHAGDIVVPPLQFRGRAMQPGGLPGFPGFPGDGRAVGAQSRASTLHARARPPASAGSPWLPAQQVELSLDGVPADARVQAGEPLTLTLTEGATGLPFEALPEPSLPDLRGAEVYPDAPQGDSRNDGHWITGTRSRSFAVVPTRAGTLQLPAITLRWWNVQEDRAETARIPARSLTVLPAVGGVAPAASAGPAAALPAVAGTSPEPATGPAPAANRPPAPAGSPWRTLALASLGLWLLAAIAAWVLWRRRGAGGIAVTAPPAAAGRAGASARRLRNAFLAAARGGDDAAAASALLAWARSQRPQTAHLEALAAALAASDQVRAVEALQRRRFAGASTASAEAPALADAFSRGFAWKSPAAPRSQPPLPPLYPPS